MDVLISGLCPMSCRNVSTWEDEEVCGSLVKEDVMTMLSAMLKEVRWRECGESRREGSGGWGGQEGVE